MECLEPTLDMGVAGIEARFPVHHKAQAQESPVPGLMSVVSILKFLVFFELVCCK